MRHLARTIALFSAVTLAGCAMPSTHGRTATVERSWKASEVSSIRIEGFNGKIRVAAGDSSVVKLRATVRLRGRDSKKSPEEVVLTRLDDGQLQISEKNTRRRKSIFVLPFGRSSDVSVSYELIVPPVMNLDLTTVNGGVRLEGVGGEFAIRTVNGSIEVTTPSAELEARTVNGAVRAKFETAFLGARVKTVNGSISVSLPAEASFRCDVSQVNGSFKTNVPMESSRRSAEGDVNGGDHPLELTTVNGTVKVERRDV